MGRFQNYFEEQLYRSNFSRISANRTCEVCFGSLLPKSEDPTNIKVFILESYSPVPIDPDPNTFNLFMFWFCYHFVGIVVVVCFNFFFFVIFLSCYPISSALITSSSLIENCCSISSSHLFLEFELCFAFRDGVWALSASANGDLIFLLAFIGHWCIPHWLIYIIYDKLSWTNNNFLKWNTASPLMLHLTMAAWQLWEDRVSISSYFMLSLNLWLSAGHPAAALLSKVFLLKVHICNFCYFHTD